MREILFRGKRKDNGEWVYGYYCKYGYTGKEKHYIIPSYASALYAIEIIPETVGQYTGLTDDKNGKKIFEGDYWIDTEENDIYVVEYRDGGFCFVIYGICGALMEYGYDEDAGGFGECDCVPMTDFNIDEIEIIGNIHDNPELLKGEQE